MLWDVARIVHEADLADDRYEAPEAPGLDALIRGLGAACSRTTTTPCWSRPTGSSTASTSCAGGPTPGSGRRDHGRRRRATGRGGRPPDRAQAFRFWLKLGMISFGGPAGQIAIMHDELVERRRWISERRFLHALNFCMALPGPEAQQLASYIGYSMHGVRGAIASGGLFVLPSFLLLCAMSAVYVEYGEVAAVRRRPRARRRRDRAGRGRGAAVGGA